MKIHCKTLQTCYNLDTAETTGTTHPPIDLLRDRKFLFYTVSEGRFFFEDISERCMGRHSRKQGSHRAFITRMAYFV